jgi:hypothetical protein
MINNIRKILNDDKLVNTYRIASKDFTRNRKLTAKSIIYYELNKKGLNSKMEIDNFIELANIPDVSLPAMLKQREKLNSDVFKYLNESTMEVFYVKNSNEVKTFDDYILTAVDGSDFEIPNTASTRETFNSYKSTLNNDVAARASISIQFDLLNKFVLDTVIKPDRTSEIEMMQENLKVSKQILRYFKTIRIMD